MFSIINKVLFSKTKKPLDSEEISEFNPFVTQRYASMYSPQLATLVNTTINKLWSGIDDNNQFYKLFMTVIPKLKFKKINYIKKADKNTNKNDNLDVIEFLAKTHELSQKEVEYYINNFDLDITKIKKSLRS